jgi:hypothetical protein
MSDLTNIESLLQKISSKIDDSNQNNKTTIGEITKVLLKKIGETKDSLNKIESYLQLDVEKSAYSWANFDFVEDKNVKKQLIKDNIGMNQAKKQGRDEDVFLTFCLYAHFQVEELLFHYYKNKLKATDDINDYFKEKKQECKKEERKKEERKFETLSDVPIANMFYNLSNNNIIDVTTRHNLFNIQQIRNMFSHRGTSLEERTKEHERRKKYDSTYKPYAFLLLQSLNFMLVETTISRFVANIKSALAKL